MFIKVLLIIIFFQNYSMINIFIAISFFFFYFSLKNIMKFKKKQETEYLSNMVKINDPKWYFILFLHKKFFLLLGFSLLVLF